MSWASQSIAVLEASLVRPFGLAVAGWLILRVLRVRHPASRHAVWTAVLIGMLLLPLVSVLTPHWTLPILPWRRDAATPVSPQVHAPVTAPDPLDARAQPTTYVSRAAAKTPAAAFGGASAEITVMWCYVAGLVAMVTYRAAGWVLLWRLVSRSRPVRARCLRESGDVLTPVAVGVLRPVVILPAAWHDWNGPVQRAVLSHEFAHLRRHDTLVSALARLVTCVFWFHPLAWWLSRKVSDLAELACDAVAVARVGDPAGYSRLLLECASAVNRRGYRVAMPGLAMATRSRIGERVDHVFELSGGPMRRLARPRVVLGVMGAPVMALAATVALGARAPRLAVVPPSTGRVQLAQALPHRPMAPARPVPQEPKATAVTKPPFASISITPCVLAGVPGTSRVGTRPEVSAGRITWDCASVKAFVRDAYFMGANGQSVNMALNRMTHIEGGPGWIDSSSDLYMIDEKAERGPSQGMMTGPALQALEDRLQLKLRFETTPAPFYELIMAKGGPARQPFYGSCTPSNFRKNLQLGQGICRVSFGGGTHTFGQLAMSLDGSATSPVAAGILVINKTEIVGRDFRLDFASPENSSSPDALSLRFSPTDLRDTHFYPRR